MNKELYNEILNRYLEILTKYQTNEQKISYLEDIKFDLNMIDRWDETDKTCIDVINDLLHQLKES